MHQRDFATNDSIVACLDRACSGARVGEHDPDTAGAGASESELADIGEGEGAGEGEGGTAAAGEREGEGEGERLMQRPRAVLGQASACWCLCVYEAKHAGDALVMMWRV
jgi:hypothetical protein